MIILLIGLPGSGKTYFAENKIDYDFFVDDPKDLSELPDNFISHQILVIADPFFCDPKIRELAQSYLSKKYHNHQFIYYFFENNPEKCRKNILHRQDDRNVDITLELLCSKYKIPEGIEAIEIYETR